MKKRLFIVSNRLPVNVETIDGEAVIKPSSGGLVSAIDSYLRQPSTQEFSSITWVGMPGCEPSDWEATANEPATANYNYLPVYVSPRTYEQYYNGLSNSTLWPLFHYFPSFTEYDRHHYKSYLDANMAFADVLQKHLLPGDVVWIHDYHLMPLPNMLRQRVEQITIGFFLHIPFPSYEIFRLLPNQWQQDLLKGVLGADLLGFHTIDYATHFLKTVQMVLGYENELNILRYDNRLVKADVFPISIDFEKFHEAWADRTVVNQRRELLQKFAGKKIIFSVDRLDYTKGVRNRLEGYKCFLEKNPEYKEKVVFVMVIVPSREYIKRYAERKKEIDEMISNINSKIGSLHWQPVIYQYNSLSFHEMLALYTACDMALITPLRDGMNLVAKEFAASRQDKRGVLLLSEMAGAARELTTALHINPNDVEDIADKILAGLTMPEAEQFHRIVAMQNRISQYNVITWANDFISELWKIKAKQQEFQVKFIDNADKRSLLDRYTRASRRLLLLDYDGTLVPFSAVPAEAVPPARLLQALRSLAADPRNDIYIISGRCSNTLENWFGDLPVHLIAEHGAKMKKQGQEWRQLVTVQRDWKPRVTRMMGLYVKRCANSFIEEKEFSVCWHYRNADIDQAKLRARELFNELHEQAAQLGIQLLLGNKIVEAKVNGANKGWVLKHHIPKGDYELIIAAGDDRTDEDMFRVLPTDTSYSIKIGPEASFAQYNLHTPEMMVSLLEALPHLPAANRQTPPAVDLTLI